MDIMTSDLNLERWVIVSIGMIFMLGSLAILANKIGPIGNGNLNLNKRKKRRMKLIETLHLDGRNRIAIIQVDDVEHVVMLGQNGDLHLHSQDTPSLKNAEEPEEAPASIGFLKEIEDGEKTVAKKKNGKKNKKK